MSLGVVVKGPEGIVLAADTRVTLSRTAGDAPPIRVNFDNASKLLTLDGQHNRVAVVTYGAGSIGGRTALSLIPEFQQMLGQPLLISEYATQIGQFFMDRWTAVGETGADMSFIVAGVNQGSPYGEIHRIEIPSAPVPQEHNPGSSFGMSWGGQVQIVNRIVQGFDPLLPSLVADFEAASGVDRAQLSAHLRAHLAFTIPYDSLPLQDCIDLAAFLIRTTMIAQNLSVGPRGVGGTIEIITITPTEGIQWIQKRQIHGESK